MRRFEKLLQGVALVGQLGFSVVTPPLVLVWLANRLVTRHGWGLWVVAAAIAVGLLSAGCSVYATAKRLLKRQSRPEEEAYGVSFREHV